MKKIGIFLLLMMVLVTGCGKKDKTSVINDFKKKVNKAKSYEIDGTMEIINDEDIFKYEINAKYLHNDTEYYKVTLTNQTNNHEQIILKNTEGVYVITPSLNKSFKFQSNWPNNSSQSYLLASLVNDMEKDKGSSYEEKDGLYIIKNKVDYPNNEELIYEKVYLNKDMTPKKVEVFDNKDNVKIRVEFSNVDLKASIDEDEFDMSNIIDEKPIKENNDIQKKPKVNNDIKPNESDIENKEQQNNKSTTSIQDIVYPLYVPENTTLKSKDVISTDNGERVILTFAGDNSFVLVEETISISDEFEIIPVYGDPQIINDSIGALSANSLSWTSNNTSYYITGNTLAKEEILNIAKSMNNVTSVYSEK